MRRDLIALPEDSKVWIFQADKIIDDETTQSIKDALYSFSMNWQSHGKELDSYAHLFHHQFVVLVADGSNLPSGCSIDSSVHFIAQLGDKYGIDFFNRMNFAYLVDEDVHTLKSTELKAAYDNKTITSETLMFDNLVNTKSEFLENWILPLAESWHTKFLS